MQNATPLHALLNPNNLLIIPYYQRGFCWAPEKRNMLERLIEDLFSCVHRQRPYYLGIVMIKTTNTAYEYSSFEYNLLDGQQRLTSMSLIIKALHLKTKSNLAFNAKMMHQDHTPIISHQKEDHADFYSIMKLEELEQVELNSYMGEAWNYICKRIKEYEGDAREVLNAIRKYVVVTTVVLDDTDDEAMIFDRINGGGVRLTTAEMLKNFLFEHAEDEYYKTWCPLFDTHEAEAFWSQNPTFEAHRSEDKNMMIEQFLYAFARIYCWQFNKSEAWRPTDAKDFVKDSNVYQNIKDFVMRFGIDRMTLAAEICEYAKLFRQYFTYDVLQRQIPKKPHIDRIVTIILSRGWHASTPYVLYVLRNVKSEDERNRIFDVLETYLMRLTIAKRSTKSLSEFFSETLIKNRVLTADELLSYMMNTTSKHLVMPTDNEVRTSLCCEKYKDQIAILILYMLESASCATVCRGYSHYDLHQLMPDKNVWNLPANTQEENDLINQSAGLLSNRILIAADKKELFKRLKKASWAEKRKELSRAVCYISSSYTLLKEKPDWTLATIEERAQRFAAHVNEKLWQIPASSLVRTA